MVAYELNVFKLPFPDSKYFNEDDELDYGKTPIVIQSVLKRYEHLLDSYDKHQLVEQLFIY